MNFLQRLLGQHDPAPVSKQRTGPVHYAPPTADELQASNASIAADGARMYQAAHPGQTYVPGQNGETYTGGISQTGYQNLLHGPLKALPRPISQPTGVNGFTMPQVHAAFFAANNPQIQLGGDSGTPIQGAQNSGYIPLQSTQSKRYAPIQNGYDQRIQY